MSAAPDMTPARSPRRVWRSRHLSFTVSPRLVAVTLLLVVLSPALATFAITLGRIHIPFADVMAILSGGGDGGIQQQIVFNIRLPRVLTAIFVGAALGVSGAVFQSVSRNALGSPDVIGFTTGAATGALVQIVFLGGGPLAVALSAVAGGMLTAATVYLLSIRNGATGGYRLVLIGIGAGATLTALNGLMLVKGDLDNAVAANLWLAGSLNARTWQHVFPVMAGCVVIIPLVGLAAARLALIEMGDDLAVQLGVNVERTRIAMIFCAVLLAGLATGAAGPIAFVALAAPQLVVRLTGSRGVPVISAAAMGACLLVLADVLTQIVPVRFVLPIGRMTGIVGGLYFVWLLTRSRRM
ncbi:iron chelate uptake ABC transporter family permease subunit [Rhizobiaceae bacterium BDR2-2]|uniref:Iron chelate uptake ABC transporter family permease subunit n=1 Tax=Ectorhizobium quercum TaxID=2965071 RepID=A0AAE3MYM7_9HYPH|nr:iron chelate uptake ABC transporter family permease subunit [Ectorhizobium quercum]MCX8997369.1 iron chelate uptake ABC transporter family permease subunit [Ectorhizobium quercum]